MALYQTSCVEHRAIFDNIFRFEMLLTFADLILMLLLIPTEDIWNLRGLFFSGIAYCITIHNDWKERFSAWPSHSFSVKQKIRQGFPIFPIFGQLYSFAVEPLRRRLRVFSSMVCKIHSSLSSLDLFLHMHNVKIFVTSQADILVLANAFFLCMKEPFLNVWKKSVQIASFLLLFSEFKLKFYSLGLVWLYTTQLMPSRTRNLDFDTKLCFSHPENVDLSEVIFQYCNWLSVTGFFFHVSQKRHEEGGSWRKLFFNGSLTTGRLQSDRLQDSFGEAGCTKLTTKNGSRVHGRPKRVMD